MSQAWKKTIAPDAGLPMGFPLKKKSLHVGLCTSVLALVVWQVAQYLLRLQNPKFLCFVSLKPFWGRCWYDVLLWGAQTSIISFDLLGIHVP